MDEALLFSLWIAFLFFIFSHFLIIQKYNLKETNVFLLIYLKTQHIILYLVNLRKVLECSLFSLWSWRWKSKSWVISDEILKRSSFLAHSFCFCYIQNNAKGTSFPSCSKAGRILPSFWDMTPPWSPSRPLGTAHDAQLLIDSGYICAS